MSTYQSDGPGVSLWSRFAHSSSRNRRELDQTQTMSILNHVHQDGNIMLLERTLEYGAKSGCKGTLQATVQSVFISFHVISRYFMNFHNILQLRHTDTPQRSLNRTGPRISRTALASEAKQVRVFGRVFSTAPSPREFLRLPAIYMVLKVGI